jgi:CheY-like chemotaxis protein
VQPNGKKRMLVVEDQITVADALNLVLKMEGYEVETARNWREALALFQPRKFALIFTDYKMPELNGHELASIIKSKDSSQPIILVTAFPNMAKEKPSRDIDMVLEKPWSIDELRAAIRKFLPDEAI